MDLKSNLVILLRLKSTFGRLTLGVFSFWPSNFKSFHFGPLRLIRFQMSFSIHLSYSNSAQPNF